MILRNTRGSAPYETYRHLQPWQPTTALFFLLLLWLWSGTVTAQDEGFAAICDACGDTPPTYSATYTRVQLERNNATLKVIDQCLPGFYRMVTSLNYASDNPFLEPNWFYELDFQVRDLSSGAISQPGTTLRLSSDTTAQRLTHALPYKKGEGFFCPKGRQLRIEVLAIRGSVPDGAKIGLELKLYNTQEVPFERFAVRKLLLQKEGSAATDNPFYTVNVRWEPIPGAASYDLEWAYLDAKDQGGPSRNPANSSRVFDYRYGTPVRVNLPQGNVQPEYSIPMTYPEGMVFYRLRGRGPDGMLGKWQYGEEGKSRNAVTYIRPKGATLGTDEVAAFSTDRNWQVQSTFAEEGKNKRVVTYYDGSLRNRQTLTNISSDNSTLVTETLYDHEGRPALSFLPVPEEGTDFNFRKEHFPLQPRGRQGKSIYDNGQRSPEQKTLAGGRYYSPENDMAQVLRDYIPDAEGHAYTQTTYTPDNTGRIRRQSGVGRNFRLHGGHNTQYFYGSTNSTELYRLFGKNVGEASHYKKNLVVDPNGQVSVSYLDQEGRTIATALAGSPPAQLEALDSYRSDTEKLRVDLSANAVFNKREHRMETEATLLNVKINTRYDFRSELTAAEAGLLRDCEKCRYRVKIEVHDPDNLPVAIDQRGDGSPIYSYMRQTACAEDLPPYVFTFVATKIGSYHIRKTISSAGSMRGEVLQEARKRTEAELGYTLEDMTTAVTDHVNENAVDCSIGTEADPDELRQLMGRVSTAECDEIYRLLEEAVLKADNTLSGEDLMLAVERHPEYCHYRRCRIDAPGLTFDREMALIRDWDEAVAKGYANPLHNEGGAAPSAMTQRKDPFFFSLECWREGRSTIPCRGRTQLASARGRLESFTFTDPTTGEEKSLGSLWETLANPDMYQSRIIDPVTRWAMFQGFYGQVKEAARRAANGSTCPYLPNGVVVAPRALPTNVEGAENWGNENFDKFLAYDSAQAQGILALLETKCDTVFEGPQRETLIGHLQSYFVGKTLAMGIEHFFGTILPDEVRSHPDLRAIETVLEQMGLDCRLRDIAMEVRPTCFELERLDAGRRAFKFGAGGRLQYAELRGQGTANMIGDYIPADFTIEATVNPDLGAVVPGRYYPAISKRTGSSGYEFGLVTGSDGRKTGTYLWINGNTYEFIGNASDDLVGCRYIGVALNGQKGFCTLYHGREAKTIDVRSEDGAPGTARLYIARSPSGEYFKGSINELRVWDRFVEREELAELESVHADGRNHNGLVAAWRLDEGSGTAFINYGRGGADYDAVFRGGGTAPAWSTEAACSSCTPRTCPRCAIGRPAVGTLTADPRISNDLCFVEVPCDDGLSVKLDTLLSRAANICRAELREEAEQLLRERFGKRWDEVATELLQQSSDRCFQGGFRDRFSYSYRPLEYHYTLYYYDQAGNLAQTVPPEGVDLLGDAQIRDLEKGMPHANAHRLTTSYRYNSLGQLLEQTMPDHDGPSRFWYDEAQQLRLSQNAQQAADGEYSYTRYDAQGRIVEVGQLEGYTFDREDFRRDPGFPRHGTTDYRLTEVTRTHYDRLDLDRVHNSAIATVSQGSDAFTAANPRGRVTAVETFAERASSGEGCATLYSYDPHGNVSTLLQLLPGLGPKRTEYRYDLISGNVNCVRYQPDSTDGFTHRYRYDADNRITQVMTSTDGYLWEEEAAYTYYRHGPLARTTLGWDRKRLQGMDHYYTLQGWLKGVNLPGYTAADDPGGDGSTNAYPEDAFRYALGYYKDDYRPIGSPDRQALTDIEKVYRPATFSGRWRTAAGQGLHNGNIAYMISHVPGLLKKYRGKGPSYGIQAMLYTYDQLNRIRTARSLTMFNNGLWSTRDINGAKPYDADYTYDANGNLTRLDRWGGDGRPGEQLRYTYPKAGGKLSSNRLDHVDNKSRITATYPAPEGGVTVDGTIVEDQAPGNYAYDSIGNLVQDKKGRVEDILWTVYGKVAQVRKYNGSTTTFRYDAAGNRILKTDLRDGKRNSTYYVRDASGNVMGIYRQESEGADPEEDPKLLEQPIYGSSRLGLYRPGQKEAGVRYWGHRQYELSNHLGNVMAIISDRRLGKDTDNDDIAEGRDYELLSASDYYPFGKSMPGRSYESEGYRYGFNGKEKDDGIKGSGNHYDYGMRMYDPRIGRPLSIDPLTAQYPELSPYQFFSNNPIWFIDLDGLEGVQYLETMKMKDGTTVTKRIVEVDVFVATSKNVKSIHYKSADLPTIGSNLKSEHNKGFKDASGNTVEFRFNVQEFDADATTPVDKAKQLRRDPNNFVKANDGSMALKGFVLERGKLKGSTQGSTNPAKSLVTIDNKAINPSHTQAHETGHIFLNYDPSNNPGTAAEHGTAGGVFKYKTVDVRGKTISPTQDVNQGNIDAVLKSVPELNSKTVEEK